MKHSEAILLRQLSKDHCSTHAFVAETYLGFITGDLICSSCGHERSKYKHVFITTENELCYALADLP